MMCVIIAISSLYGIFCLSFLALFIIKKGLYFYSCFLYLFMPRAVYFVTYPLTLCYVYFRFHMSSFLFSFPSSPHFYTFVISTVITSFHCSPCSDFPPYYHYDHSAAAYLNCLAPLFLHWRHLVYQSPIAPVANCYKLGVWQQHEVILRQFWRSEV